MLQDGILLWIALFSRGSLQSLLSQLCGETPSVLPLAQ